MQQQQFLGRTALCTADRFLLTRAATVVDLGIDEDTLVRYLGDQGHTPAQAREAAQDPVRYVRSAFDAARSTPELTRTLAGAGASAHLVAGVRRFGDAVARLDQPVLLDRCAADDHGGGFEVAYHVLGCGVDVEDGDLFHGGFMLRGNGRAGTMTVAPRLVRQICRNGLTQITDQAGDACSYQLDVDGRASGELDQVLALGTCRENVRTVVERMQALQRRRAADAIEALQREGARVPAWAHARVRAVFAENGDTSLYGALNALTQTARDAATSAERARLETVAGHLAPACVLASSRASFDL